MSAVRSDSMSTLPPVQVVAAPRRRFRKVLVFALLGVLLGGVVVIFFDRVYNPFEEGIGDRQLLVLAPGDADLLVFIPHVARFLGEMRDRPFSRVLADDQRFQRFLQSDYAKRTGAVEALSTAFRELDLIRARPPLGLDLWGDISGESLLLAAYAPSQAGQPWQYIAMFRPSSWKVLAAVNVLVDPWLGDLGPIRNGLESGGVSRVDRFRDSVTLSLESGSALSIARIRNVVVVGTEVDRITRLKTTIERDRLPASPAPRYAELSPDPAGSPYEVRAIVRRRIADEQLQLSSRLDREWGRDNVALLEATLPRFAGEDMLAVVTLDEDLDLTLRIGEGSPRQHDLGRSFRAYPRDDAGVAFGRVAPLLPESTFAFAHLLVDVPQFLEAFFQRPEIFTAADLANLRDALQSVPDLGDLSGLKNKLAQICDGKVSIGFFKQDRDVLDKPAAGCFVAWHLQDEKELRRLLDSLDRQVRERAARGVKSIVRDLVHTGSGEADVYEIVLPEGVVDDPRVTKLGLVVGREVLIVTNFIPSFRALAQVKALDERTIPPEATLIEALSRGPDQMRIDGAIAGDALYGYFDQAYEGWVVQKTTPSARDEREWRAMAESEARVRGLKEGTPEFKKVVEDAYQRRLDGLIKIKRPQERREIQTHLEYFRGLVRSIGFSIGEHDGLEISLRIALDSPAP
jgi:hypothetical protein